MSEVLSEIGFLKMVMPKPPQEKTHKAPSIMALGLFWGRWGLLYTYLHAHGCSRSSTTPAVPAHACKHALILLLLPCPPPTCRQCMLGQLRHLFATVKHRQFRLDAVWLVRRTISNSSAVPSYLFGLWHVAIFEPSLCNRNRCDALAVADV